MAIVQNLIDFFFQLVTLGFEFTPFVLLCIAFFLFCVIGCAFRFLIYGRY